MGSKKYCPLKLQPDSSTLTPLFLVGEEARFSAGFFRFNREKAVPRASVIGKNYFDFLGR